ncbi:MAG TPA: tRNA (adenosine(37)-N6)-threonylcarbamoyltransferase complex transferase subunit TsaD [Candidatus Sulfotelmatobacter sp.]|jgi:N6-L-threonylcarbamoyladenine synthase|nr:tRNA (adenosine(37)-N6)-threonylcarbamoyltransferase complex transferase subunit TsaD [Candidatus Sulfotelmatobacter sp.]
MTILGIETSCDETAVALIEGNENRVTLKANMLATSLALHAKTGGIIPEQAAREQIKYILPVLKNALETTGIDTLETIDAIAVTYGPGLIGSLLVGVETAKTLAFVFNKPIIPVNHMVGHVYANFISENKKPVIQFPLLALVVSGGHTDLLLMKNHGDFQLLGGTRDDAAGEAFDKIGRMLGLSYPAGPEIERLAKEGDPKRFRFPRPLLHENTYEFSFSGLKTAVLREVTNLHTNRSKLDLQTIKDLARATQDAIIEVIIKKTLKAAKEHTIKSILLSGGVAANQALREQFEINASKQAVTIFAPTKNLCTDNAAMIASAAYFNFHPIPWKGITTDPELYFE